MSSGPAVSSRGVVVFAHTPPPLHGQSAMVKLMLDLFAERGAGVDRADPKFSLRFHHVNARLSQGLDDVGEARWSKILVLLKYCAQAVWLRWRWRAPVLYYVPAPPARTPVVRDWIVMALCRPFFSQVVFHWHAGGLSHWVKTSAGPLERALTRWLLGRPDLSLVLRPFHRRDADYFRSRRVAVVPNGIPDPCPDYETDLRAVRERRANERQRRLSGSAPVAIRTDTADGTEVFRVLYLSVCRREKGLFEAVEAVMRANQTIAPRPLRVELTVAGEFWSAADRAEFEERLRAPDLAANPSWVRYAGFVQGKAKDALLRETDCLCLPTYLPEGMPVVLMEALAYGVAPVATRWCDLQEMLPPGYPGVVAARAPDELAACLVQFAGRAYDPGLRAYFLAHYTAARFAEVLTEAFRTLDAHPAAGAVKDR